MFKAVRSYKKAILWLSLGLCVTAIDQASKWAALQHLEFQKAFKVTSFFNLFLDFNQGAAFNFLSHETGWQVWFFSIIAIMICLGIVIYFFVKPHLSWPRFAGLALIFGGALGNLIDRLSYGHVIDFISWHVKQYYWPTFNLADSAVCLGVVMLFFNLNVNKD